MEKTLLNRNTILNELNIENDNKLFTDKLSPIN